MSLSAHLRATPPGDLAPLRAIAHQALQAPSLGARANLAEQPDDSHANFGWSAAHDALTTHPLATSDGPLQLGVRLAPLSLITVRSDAVAAQYALDGRSTGDALDWVDARLKESGLTPARSTTAPFQLPDDAAVIQAFDVAGRAPALKTLSAWISEAHAALEQFAGELSDVSPGPSPVRLWPHHFDIATYVSLEEGDPETARGVGVGLAPGDGAYDQPYFYVNPWPHPAGAAPTPPAPGRWHTDGFVGAIATAEAILAEPGGVDLKAYLSETFQIVRAVL